MSAVIVDSGHRREFSTGAVRDMSEGKGRFDLCCPYADHELARHMERGAKKYGERNWEKGIPQSSFQDSAERHLANHKKGLTNEDHLLAAYWNLHCMVSQRARVAAGVLTAEAAGMTTAKKVVDRHSELVRLNVPACLALCDSLFDGEEGCKSAHCGEFVCGDKGCSDFLLETERAA